MKRKQTYQSPQTSVLSVRASKVMMSSAINGSGESYDSEAGSYGGNSGETFGTEGGAW